MESYVLHLNERPQNDEFRRVHAILVMPDGRVLLRYKNGDPRITGGRIDAGDLDLAATLRREVREEINCEIDRCDYIGYLELEKRAYYEGIGVKVDDLEGVEYWARMVARVSKIGAPQPDPDRENNWIYGRELVTPEVAREKLTNSAPVGNMAELVDLALAVAQEKGYFTEEISQQNEMLNPETVDGEAVKNDANF